MLWHLTLDSPATPSRPSAATSPLATITALILVASMATSCGRSGTSAPDLSPATWEPGELERYTELTQQYGTRRPAGEGRHGVVAATSSPLAVRAAVEALKHGGSAVDAAITHALADIALRLGSSVSYAGFATLMYYDAATATVHSMDAGFNTVRGETDPLSIPTWPAASGRTALIPGFMAGVEAAHQKFGKLPFATLFEPALFFAEAGMVLDSNMAWRIEFREDVLSRLPATWEVFSKPSGERYQRGDLFRQPALAQTLRAVAREGASYMYTGEWGQAFVDAVRTDGGMVTAEDMADYEVTWNEPLRGRYREYEIATPHLPTYGGVHLIEAFNLLELAELTRLGHYTTSPDALAWLMQIGRVSELVGPMGHSGVSLGGLDRSHEARLSKEVARALWKRMQDPRWEEDRVGELSRAPSPGTSTAVVAVDAHGNVAALLHTINTLFWGTTGIVVGGISIPDAAAFQQKRIRQAGAGQRLPNPVNPLLVLKNGRPFLASSSVGSGLHAATLQSLVNVLDYGMTPKDAADTAQFLGQHAVQAGDFSDHVIAEARQRWPLLEVTERGSRGMWVGVRIDHERGVLEGGVSRYINGYALGY